MTAFCPSLVTVCAALGLIAHADVKTAKLQIAKRSSGAEKLTKALTEKTKSV